MKKIFAIVVISIICFSVFAMDEGGVNSFDARFMKPYNEVLDKVGTGLTIGSLLTPSVLLSQPSDQYLTLGTMYAETLLLTYGTKELVKHLVDRNRPYTYYDGAPEKDRKEWNESFPSGHTSMAFASAAFTSYVFCKTNPDSNMKLPVVLACSALAVATAVLRVQSGNHFVTDAFAGAAIGTLYGILVPMLHTLNSKSSASPFGLYFSFGF